MHQKKQRQSKSSNIKELIIINHVYSEHLLPAWEIHFGHFAIPTNKEAFTTEKQSLASINVSKLQAAMKLESPNTKLRLQSII